MSLRMVFIFVVYTTLSTPLLATSYDVSTPYPESNDASDIQLMSYFKEDQTFVPADTTLNCDDTTLDERQDSPPRELDQEERDLLFSHEALQNFSAQNQCVSICFDVVNEHTFGCEFNVWCAKGSPDSKAFVTLRLGNEKGAIIRNLSLYDAVRVGFLRCIKDGIMQKTPFYSPELGEAAAALIKLRRAEFALSSVEGWIPEGTLQMWEKNVCPFSPTSGIIKAGEVAAARRKKGSFSEGIPQNTLQSQEEKEGLCYHVTKAEEWPSGVVRITVGKTALTGFRAQPSTKYICDDGSAFFEAIKHLLQKNRFECWET